MEYFGAIDQGTTSTRFIVFDNSGKIVEQHQEEFNQFFPDEGMHLVIQHACAVLNISKTSMALLSRSFV